MVHEALREEVAAVLLDEALQIVPTLAAADVLEDRKPHAPAVGQPGAKQGFGGLLEEGDQFAVVARLGFARRSSARLGPAFAGGDQAADNRPAADLEHLVEFGDGAGADGVVVLHLLDRGDQLHRFLQEAQPRQIGQQAAEHGLQAPRGDDPLRVAAAGQGHVQQGLLAEGRDQTPPDLPHPLRIAAQHGPQRRFRRLFPGLLAFARAAAVHHHADHPHGVARLHAGGDDLLQQHLLDAAAAFVFHQRLLRAARRRNAVAIDRGQQVEKLLPVLRRLVEPAGQHRFALVGRQVGPERSHGRQLPKLGQRGEEGQPPHDPFGLFHELEVGGARRPCRRLRASRPRCRLRCCRGRSRLRRRRRRYHRPRLPPRRRPIPRPPVRTAAPPNSPRRWPPGNRGTCGPGPSAAAASGGRWFLPRRSRPTGPASSPAPGCGRNSPLRPAGSGRPG